MKVIVLLLAFVICLGAAFKNTADSVKAVSHRFELASYQDYPNLLPVVEISASRF